MTIEEFINKHDLNQKNDDGPKWRKFCRCVILPNGEIFEVGDNLEETLIEIICDKYNVSKDSILKYLKPCCHTDYFVGALNCVVICNYDSGIMSENSINYYHIIHILKELEAHNFIKPLAWFNYTVENEHHRQPFTSILPKIRL